MIAQLPPSFTYSSASSCHSSPLMTNSQVAWTQSLKLSGSRSAQPHTWSSALVQQGPEKSNPTPTPTDHVHFVLSHAQRSSPSSVLTTLNLFASATSCLSTTTTLNPKAPLIVDEVLSGLDPCRVPSASDPLIMLEPLGASCLGYSAIYFASALATRFGHANVRYVAMETDPERAHAAQQIIKYAGLDGVVKVMLGTVQERVQDLPARVDVLLLMQPQQLQTLDALYMHDVWRLLELGILAKGSTVIADNMMQPGAPEYERWVQTHQGLESRRYEVVLEEEDDDMGEEELDAIEVSVVL